MTFEIDVADMRVRFSRNWFTGGATVSANGKTKIAQSAWDPMTHISTSLKRGWAWRINGHTLTIEKERPLLFPGLRPHTYRAFVNDKLVLERTGY
jgi:hypothetical protein